MEKKNKNSSEKIHITRSKRSSKGSSSSSFLLKLFRLLAVVSFRNFIVTAQAFSSSSSSIRTVAAHSSLQRRSIIYPNTALLLSSSSSSSESSESESNNNNTDNSTLSSSSSSSIWSGKDTNGNRELKQYYYSPDPKARTGWLHNNTKSSSKKKEQQDQQQQRIALEQARKKLLRAMILQERNHRMVSIPTFHATDNIGKQLVITEHKISVPIYRRYEQKEPRMDIYFTIVEMVNMDDDDYNELSWWKSLQQNRDPTKRAELYVKKASLQNANELLLYLQGGPGFGSPTPIVGLSVGSNSDWAGKALSTGKFSRIILMDQRGTGRSSPVTKQTLQRQFPDLFLLDDKVKKDLTDDDIGEDIVTVTNDVLEEEVTTSEEEIISKVNKAITDASHFMGQLRADNIVRDAEEIKEALLLPVEEGGSQQEPRPYGAALGQSFGGFCMMTYLSQIPYPPRICLMTGGIAPMLTPTYDVYMSLWKRVKERSLLYYEMYPDDIGLVKRIVQALLQQPQILPSGGKLTARRFLNLGLNLGGSPSSFASMHDLLTSAFVNDDIDNEFSKAFLKRIDSAQSFDDHPIYFLLHESIYADGPGETSSTKWAAHRAYLDLIQSNPEYDYKQTSTSSSSLPTLFFGEMVFPWFANGDFMEVSGLGMKLLSNTLANRNDWEKLYDVDHMRMVQQDERSRVACAIYYNDLYVDFDACTKVIQRGLGPLEKAKVWITNEYQHSGLRDDGATIFTKLYGMATGSVRVPS